MGNLPEIASWFRARLYCTNFRPVPLSEYVVFGKKVFATSGDCERELKQNPAEFTSVVTLCQEGLGKGQQVIIFCSSRRNAVACATRVAKHLASCTDDTTVTHRTRMTDQQKSRIKALRKSGVMRLGEADVVADNALHRLISVGVAYHHAGLTVIEREVIEKAFREGTTYREMI
jgi:replicative superfamily II helicase